MEQHFILHSERIRQNAANYIGSIPLEPVPEIIVRPFERVRTNARNRMYWACLTESLQQINQTVNYLANESGHSPLEIKRIIAKDLEPEYVALLFARTPEAAHDILKEISNIPTSTRLGTKKFIQFQERMESMLSEIVGQINDFAGRAVG